MSLLALPLSSQAWQPSVTRDQMLDRPDVVLLLRPTRVDGATGERPRLIIRCNADSSLDAFVSTNGVVDSYDHDVSVLLRWMEEPPVQQEWNLGDGMTSTFTRTPKLFILSLLNNRRLRVRVNMYSRGSLTAHYAVPPIPTRYLAIFQRQCSLPTKDGLDPFAVVRVGDRFSEPLNLQTPNARLDSMRRIERASHGRWLAAVTRDSSQPLKYLITDGVGRTFTIFRPTLRPFDTEAVVLQNEMEALDQLEALDFALYGVPIDMTPQERRLARYVLAIGRCEGVHGIARGPGKKRQLVCTSRPVLFTPVP